MISREAVVAEARKWIGTPFAHLGRAQSGIDCLGFIGMVGLALKVEGAERWRADTELGYYGLTVHRPDILIRKCDEYLDRIAVPAAGLGDILLLRFGVMPQHFAIISRVEPRYVVHAYNSPSVQRVVEQGASVARAKMYRAYRFRGVAP